MPIVAASADSAQTSVAEKRTLWQKVKAEILHYYHGFRLLFLDMKISAKLIWRIVNGKELSRREHRLVRCMLLSELSVILFCFVFYPSNFTKMISHDLIFFTAGKNHRRYVQTDSVLGLHYRSFHGASTTCSYQIFPWHVTVDLPDCY